MTQAAPTLLTFNQFITQYGDDSRYELIDGELIDMEPTGLHEEVAALILRKFNVEIDRLNLPWFTPQRCLIRLLGKDTAFRPDIIVLDKAELSREPLWQKEPVITSGVAIKLVVEVVSTNWQNDYARKVEDYAALGIPEYWIVDHAALGGKLFIGNPKQPTISIYQLVGDTYSVQRFRAGDVLTSLTFPDLHLTADQILAIGQSIL